MNNLELKKHATDVRKGIVTAVHSAKAGHPGGSLSAADMFTFLYFEAMNIDPQNPGKEDRDRFVLSKGHTAPGLYSALANRGYFPVEDLTTLRKLGSYLQGHPCVHIPGVDMSSGSLGQGISAAVGMAMGGKLDNNDFRVYTMLGDGELEEVAKMAYRAETINPRIQPAPQELQDKHYYRKHGANAYYGQKEQ